VLDRRQGSAWPAGARYRLRPGARRGGAPRPVGPVSGISPAPAPPALRGSAPPAGGGGPDHPPAGCPPGPRPPARFPPRLPSLLGLGRPSGARVPVPRNQPPEAIADDEDDHADQDAATEGEFRPPAGRVRDRNSQRSADNRRKKCAAEGRLQERANAARRGGRRGSDVVGRCAHELPPGACSAGGPAGERRGSRSSPEDRPAHYAAGSRYAQRVSALPDRAAGVRAELGQELGL